MGGKGLHEKWVGSSGFPKAKINGQLKLPDEDRGMWNINGVRGADL